MINSGDLSLLTAEAPSLRRRGDLPTRARNTANGPRLHASVKVTDEYGGAATQSFDCRDHPIPVLRHRTGYLFEHRPAKANNIQACRLNVKPVGCGCL